MKWPGISRGNLCVIDDTISVMMYHFILSAARLFESAIQYVVARNTASRSRAAKSLYYHVLHASVEGFRLLSIPARNLARGAADAIAHLISDNGIDLRNGKMGRL